MLPIRSRWHIAANRLPIGEARICRFATTPPPTNPGNTGGTDPEIPDNEARAEGRTDDTVNRTEGEARANVNDALQGQAPDDANRARGNIGEAAGATHERAAGALDGRDTPVHGERQQEIDRTLAKVIKMHDTLEKLSGTMALLSAEAKSTLGGEAHKKWFWIESIIRELFEKAKLMRLTAWKIGEWEHGNISPLELHDFLKQMTLPEEASFAQRTHGADRKERHEQERQRQAVLGTIMGTVARSGQTNYNFSESGDPWETRNESSKQMAVQMVNDALIGRGDDAPNIGAYLTMLLNDANDRADALQEALQQTVWKVNDKEETIEQFVDRIEKGLQQKKKEDEEGKGQGTGKKGFFGTLQDSLGIRFYSPLEVMEAFTKVKDAYINAYKQRSGLRSDVLAQQMGSLAKYLPWGGKDIPHTLDSHLDEANDKVKSHHMEYLKRRNATYEECFGPGGELAHNAHDGNIARGVLEYAASRGWLYDIDLNTEGTDGFLEIRTTDGSKYSLRSLVPENWNDHRTRDYYSILITQHNAGKNEETEKYYKRYYNVNDPDDFVRLIREEMTMINLWATRGIIKRAFERGLKSHVSPWVAATVVQLLEEKSELRRVATQDWFDQIGGVGTQAYYTSHFTAGFFKANRVEFAKWVKEGDPHRLEDVGDFGKVLLEIRKEIKEKTGIDWAHASTEQKRDLNERIGEILAGKTVDIKGKSFSIFNKRYEFYRNCEMIKKLGELRPGVKEEDPDYYNDICENVLGNSRIVEQILAPTGRGTFANEDQAMSYMTRILDVYDNLTAKGLRGEAETFRFEMGPKLHNAMKAIVADSRAGGMDELTLTGPRYGRFDALPKLLEQGFIDLESVINGVFTNANGWKLAHSMLLKNSRFIHGKDLLVDLEKARDMHTRGNVQEKERAEQEYKRIIAEWRRRLSARNGRPALVTTSSTPTGGTTPAEGLRGEGGGMPGAGAGDIPYSMAT